jgi:hypothetical protein
MTKTAFDVVAFADRTIRELGLISSAAPAFLGADAVDPANSNPKEP